MREYRASSGSAAADLWLLAAAAVALVPVLAGCAGSTATGPGAAEQEAELDVRPDQLVYRGMNTSELKSLVGEPKEIEALGDQQYEKWFYDFGVVIVEDGRVKFKYPPTRSRQQ